MQELRPERSTTINLTPRAGELYCHTAIRGIAALCVVAFHGMVGSAGKEYTDNPIQSFILTSFIFVDFFFILSGFIMFENYGKKIAGPNILANTTQYWKKRLLKILPNYYFWLIVAVALSFMSWAYFGNRTESNQCLENSFLKHLVLAQNLTGSCYYFNVPLWSIAVEMIAYLIFPVIILWRLGWLFTLLIGATLYAILFTSSETIDITNGYFSVLRCLAGFLCGVAAAKMTVRNAPDFVQLALVVLLVVAISLNYQIAALCLMFVVTITTAQNSGLLSKILKTKLPYLIGRASFSIYLAHVPVGIVLSLLAFKLESETGVPFGSDWKIIIPLEILASSIIGIFAYLHVEQRFERGVAKWNAYSKVAQQRP